MASKKKGVKSAESKSSADEIPAWLQSFLEAQITWQNQAQEQARENQELMHQLLDEFSSRQRQPEGNPRSTISSQSMPENSSELNVATRRTKADAQKPPMLQAGISLAEFSKWRKAYNDYVMVTSANELPHNSQLALLRSFFSSEMREAVEHILLIPDDTAFTPDEVLDKIKEYIRSQRNIALDCVAFEERKQAPGETFDSYLIAIKTLARDADLCTHCLNRRLVTKIMTGISDKNTRAKLLAMSPLPDIQKVTNICRSEESAKSDAAQINKKVHERQVYRSKSH